MKNKGYFLPASILIAAILISGAVIWSAGKSSGDNPADTANDVNPSQAGDPAELIAPVTDADYIRGDKNAPLKIVEYSDLECPYCKQFHSTMQQVVDEYDGQVAWVYRQFPISSLHSKAPKESEAALCAGKLGGEEAFWAYTDRIFNITPSNNNLDLSQLPEIAEYVGLDRETFNQCLDSGQMTDVVDKSVEDANNIDSWVRSQGGRGIGTPFSIVLGPDGETQFFIPGALPFNQVQISIDQALSNLE